MAFAAKSRKRGRAAAHDVAQTWSTRQTGDGRLGSDGCLDRRHRSECSTAAPAARPDSEARESPTSSDASQHSGSWHGCASIHFVRNVKEAFRRSAPSLGCGGAVSWADLTASTDPALEAAPQTDATAGKLRRPSGTIACLQASEQGAGADPYAAERWPNAAPFELEPCAQGFDTPWVMQGVSQLGDCGAAWLEADMDACCIPLPGDPPAHGTWPKSLDAAQQGAGNELLARVPELTDARRAPPLTPVPDLLLDNAAMEDLDSSLSGDSWSRFDATDVDELGMADLELPVLGDLLIEQGAQLAPSATVSPPMWADLEQRWAGSFHADSEELSEPSTGTALRHTLAQAGTRRAGNHKSGIPDLQPTVLRNACTTAPPSHSSICHQTAQFSEYAGRADLPLPVLAVGAAIARPSGESAAAQGSPASLMPGIDGPDPAPHGGCARPRKCGRPRVYDTVTPVLEAAEAAAAGVPPPVRRCRGAKPKYVCHTEQEAVAKRRERNRAAALSSYYQRKARQQRLEFEASVLRSDLSALEVVLCRLQNTPSLSVFVRPLLLAGVAAEDILLRLEAL